MIRRIEENEVNIDQLEYDLKEDFLLKNLNSIIPTNRKKITDCQKTTPELVR
jgi:hypothetical protein